MLTHWLTCLQPQRLSTKPSLLPNAWMRWHSQHPWQTRGHPARLNSDLEAFPRLWISDSQETLYATAAPAFESALCFTYNIQADANLCNCTCVMLSHPRHTHPPPHTTNPSTCSSGLGSQGWCPAHPIPGRRAAQGLLSLGMRGLRTDSKHIPQVVLRIERKTSVP